jgi:hypothetical protein
MEWFASALRAGQGDLLSSPEGGVNSCARRDNMGSNEVGEQDLLLFNQFGWLSSDYTKGSSRNFRKRLRPGPGILKRRTIDRKRGIPICVK